MNEKGMRYRRQDAHEQLKQGKLHAGEEKTTTSHLPFITVAELTNL